MSGAKADIHAIFCEALDRNSPEEAARYLDKACGGDTALRAQMEELLSSHRAAGQFLGGAPEGPGTQIGSYKLLEEIDEGSFGIVYMAEQTQPLRRKVALKILKPGMDSRQVIARFEAERQALALMDHPNIARVLDGGTTGTGRPYFVMDLVKGVPITKFCDQNHLTPGERLGLFITVCHAVQHAHQKGIIHRDLKPSNILVAPYDGKPVVKVIDFGVAKAIGQQLTERTCFTEFGAVIGTVEYMSPEQAELNNADIDTRSDIYSLGVLLYELLTGTTPLERNRVKEKGMLEALRLIREEETQSPSARLSTVKELPAISARRQTEPAKLTKLLRGELDWIVMKSLEKDRAGRYETASSFAMDVRRYLEDEPVMACPPSAWYRFRKFARRNWRVVATVAAAASVAVLAVSGLATTTLLIANEQRETEQVRDDLRHDTYWHRIALAHRELSADRLGRAIQFLQECPKDLRGWEWDYLERHCRVEPMVLRDKTEVNSLAFGPGGNILASAVGDGSVTIWNSRTGKRIRKFEAHANAVYSVAFHPHGTHIGSVGADRKVKVWDLMTDHPVFTRLSVAADHNRGTGYGVAFSPDGKCVAFGSDGAVQVWDWENDQLLLTLQGHAAKGINVAFSRDGRLLASGGWGGSVMIWNAETGTRLHNIPVQQTVSALAFSPDGRRLFVACFGRRLIVLNATTGERLDTFEEREGLVLGVAVSLDGSRIASAGEDKTVRIWEAATGREVLDLRGHTEWSQCVAFSPDGLRLASTGGDGTVRIWDGTPVRGDEAKEVTSFVQPGEVWTIAVSPDGERIVSAGLGRNMPVTVWDARSGRESFESPHWAVVFSVAWHPDGQRIAIAGWDANRKKAVVTVWDPHNGSSKPFSVGMGETYAVAFSPRDGEYLVTGSASGSLGGTLQVWDARAGQLLGTLGTHARPVRGLVFSNSGRWLASASSDGLVKLWEWDVTRLGDEQTPHRTFRARVPVAGSMTFAFSPDGRYLVAGGEEHTVQIWDLETGEAQVLRGHSGDVWATAFSPDPEGRWIASAGEDSTVKVWDRRSGQFHNFRGHRRLVSSFCPEVGTTP
jgi:WD40 repeat protein/serine/threonine protein kinase